MRSGVGAVAVLGIVVIVACSDLDGLSSAGDTTGTDGGPDGAAPGSDASSQDGGGSGDGGDAGPTADEACAAFGEALCARRTACAPASVQTFFGGPAACEAAVALHCKNDLAAPGVRAKPADYAKCAQNILTQSCDDLLSGKRPAAACALTGDVADGEPCIGDIQCASGFCASIDAKGCGVCRSASAVDAACGFGCEPGLVCSSGTCIARRAVDQPCQNANECLPSLQCSAESKCVPWAELNQSCGSSNACNASLAIGCASDSNTCQSRTVVQPGESCVVTNPAGMVCLGGICRPVNMVPTCTAFAAEGEACTDRPCRDPYRCNAGQCVLAKMAFCTK